MSMKYAMRSEDTEQINVVSWANWNANRYPELRWLFHVPNGGSRNKQEAVKFKQMGVKAGVSDLCLPYPKGIYCGLGLYSLYADAKIQVTAEEITSEVNKKVNSDDFGTLITQNAYNVRVAFNNGSSYMQFDSTGITMYTGTITDNQKRTRFDYNGTHFYRDGYYVGKIGTNTMKDNDSQRGLVFDIEYNTAYMSWSNKESQNADVYTMKWSYCTQQCGNYEANMLHAGADINMHFFTLRNVSFENGSISGTLTFKQPLEVGSDGKLTKWSTATLEFKRGILVSGTWSNG